MIVLAFDPSTDVTGVALVEIPESGCPTVLAFASMDATEAMKQATQKHPERRKEDGIRPRLRRIAWTRSEIAGWIADADSRLPLGIDLVAFEKGGGPGSQSDQAGDMALGCYLTISPLLELPLVAVMRGAACTSVGAHTLYREKAGVTYQQKKDKRDRLKAAVIAGVNQRCALFLRSDQDAEADAIAVGIAAGEQWWREQKAQKAAAAQTSMKLRRSPVKKKETVS